MGSLKNRPSCDSLITWPQRRHWNSPSVIFGRTSVALRTRPSTDTSLPTCLARRSRISTRESRGRSTSRRLMSAVLISWCMRFFSACFPARRHRSGWSRRYDARSASKRSRSEYTTLTLLSSGYRSATSLTFCMYSVPWKNASHLETTLTSTPGFSFSSFC